MCMCIRRKCNAGYGSCSARESGKGYGDVFCEGAHPDEVEMLVQSTEVEMLVQGTEEANAQLPPGECKALS